MQSRDVQSSSYIPIIYMYRNWFDCPPVCFSLPMKYHLHREKVPFSSALLPYERKPTKQFMRGKGLCTPFACICGDRKQAVGGAAGNLDVKKVWRMDRHDRLRIVKTAYLRRISRFRIKKPLILFVDVNRIATFDTQKAYPLDVTYPERSPGGVSGNLKRMDYGRKKTIKSGDSAQFTPLKGAE